MSVIAIDRDMHRDNWLAEFSVEERILLVCARLEMSAEDAQKLEYLLREPVDWAELVEKARWQKLAGWLYRHVSTPRYTGLIPATVTSELKGDYLRTTARYLYARSELKKILQALGDRSIKTIVLKGGALVGSVYDDAGLRPMADLDLLVPGGRLEEAYGVVKGLGYRVGEDSDDRPDHWASHQHLPILLGIGKPIAVEVHRHVVRLDGPLAFDIAGFWERAQSTTFDDVLAYRLAPEDLLLHLCINFFRDRRFYSIMALGQLCDIAQVARHYEDLNWQAFLLQVRQYQLEGPVASCLALSQQLLDSPVPEFVLTALAPDLDQRMLRNFARQRVVSTKEWVATDLVEANENYSTLTLGRSIVRRLVPTREYMKLHHGSDGLGAYAKRLGQAFRMGSRFIRRPSDLTDDLNMDKWLHSLTHRDSLGDRKTRRSWPWRITWGKKQ